ncbi:MAG: TonB-dependent receptor, partial [Bacteroidota bacterium]
DVAIDTEYETTNGEIAGYGELGFNFKSNTRVVLGYRYSNIKFSDFQKKLDGFFLDDPVWGEGNMNEGETFKTEENVSTYKVGVEQEFNKDIFAYVLASSGYRPGGYNEATMNVPFTTFHSDKLWNYELGLKTTWFDGHFRANVAAYMLKYDDIQLNIQDMETFIRATKNVGKAQVMGVEFSLNYFVNENFQLALSGSLSSPELLEDIQPTIIDPTGDPNDPDNLIYTGRAGDKLPGSATESFSFSANYKKSINDNLEIFANANYKYVGTRLNNFNLDLDVELPAYSLVDFRAGATHSSGVTVALFADNLLDEAITYNIDRIGSFEAAPTNRPRTVGLNLSYKF